MTHRQKDNDHVRTLQKDIISVLLKPGTHTLSVSALKNYPGLFLYNGDRNKFKYGPRGFLQMHLDISTYGDNSEWVNPVQEQDEGKVPTEHGCFKVEEMDHSTE